MDLEFWGADGPAAPLSQLFTTAPPPATACHPPCNTPQASVAGDSLAPVEVSSSARAEELFRQLALPATFHAEVWLLCFLGTSASCRHVECLMPRRLYEESMCTAASCATPRRLAVA